MNMPSDPGLEVQGLGRCLGSDGTRWLYRQMTFACRPGTFTAVIGPNGAGKSTLLRELVGLHRPQHGSVKLDGRDLALWPARLRARRLAYLPQRFPLPEGLSVRRLVLLGRAPHMGWWSGAASTDFARVEHAMSMAGVEAIAERIVTTLSGGEVQRVMIARMLATDTRMLVLDEPTTSLDARHALHVLELLAALARRGHTICVAMHELELARRYADHVVLLEGEEGRWTFGETHTTLTADRLASVFGVVVGASNGLSLSLSESTREAILAGVAPPAG